LAVSISTAATDVTAPETNPAPTPAPRRNWLRFLLPHAITAIVAVAASLGTLALLSPQIPAAAPAPTAAPAPPAPSASAGQSAVPSPRPTPRAAPPQASGLPLSQGISQQELADIRAEADRKQAQIYLLLAIVQIDDAEVALRSNELASVGQSLVAIDNSLDLAYARYERAGDSARDAIAQRRIEVGKMHDDLYLYPEGMDARLSTMRQLTLALITEQRR
jgi:hypothetical protein